MDKDNNLFDKESELIIYFKPKRAVGGINRFFMYSQLIELE